MSDLKRWVDEIEGAAGAERLLLETARDDDPGDEQTSQLWARLGPLIGPLGGPLGSPPPPASPPPTTPPSTAPPALPPPAMPAPLAPAGAAPAAAKIGALAAKKALVTAGLTKALAVGGLGAGLAFGFYDAYGTRAALEARSAPASTSASAGPLASAQSGKSAQPGGPEANALDEPSAEPLEPAALATASAAPLASAEPGVAAPAVVGGERGATTQPVVGPTSAKRASSATSNQALGQGPPTSPVNPAAVLPPPTSSAGLATLLPPPASPALVAPQVSVGADPPGAAASASAARPRNEASTAGRLVEESRLVVRARDELRRGQAGAALRTLDELGRSFPAGALTHERAALEVQALAAAGRREQARAKARAFVAAHPSSPLAPVVGQFAK